MEIRTKKCKSGNVWRFVNETWSNSNGWGHKTTVFRWDYDYEPHKIKYLNRTWEMYTYQSCMSNAIRDIYCKELNNYIENYKYSKNISKFSKGEKERVIKEFDETEMGKDLMELQQAISNREFSTIEVN